MGETASMESLSREWCERVWHVNDGEAVFDVEQRNLCMKQGENWLELAFLSRIATALELIAERMIPGVAEQEAERRAEQDASMANNQRMMRFFREYAQPFWAKEAAVIRSFVSVAMNDFVRLHGKIPARCRHRIRWVVEKPADRVKREILPDINWLDPDLDEDQFRATLAGVDFEHLARALESAYSQPIPLPDSIAKAGCKMENAYQAWRNTDMSQRTTSPIALSMFQSAQAVLTIAVLDEDGEEVALAGMTLRFVVHDSAVPAAGEFDVETGSISKSGNVASVTVSPSQSATAGTHYHWELWDVTTESQETVLANGSLVIKPAVKDVA